MITHVIQDERENSCALLEKERLLFASNKLIPYYNTAEYVSVLRWATIRFGGGDYNCLVSHVIQADSYKQHAESLSLSRENDRQLSNISDFIIVLCPRPSIDAVYLYKNRHGPNQMYYFFSRNDTFQTSDMMSNHKFEDWLVEHIRSFMNKASL